MDRIVTPKVKEKTLVRDKVKHFARYWVLPTVVGVAGIAAIKLNVDGFAISCLFNGLGVWLIISANELYKQDKQD